MIDGAITNPQGKIFLRYFQPIPKMVTVGNNSHVCDVRHGVSMLLVEESEAIPLLSYLGGCCGGQKKVFSLANQAAVNVWENNER